MALARPLSPLWQTLLPALSGAAPVRPLAALLPSLSIPPLPSLADIWTGILNAVPKKKTSYRKKRQRFLVGKALKDITSLNRCSACGRIKRMHVLCPYCVDAIKTNIFGQINWSIRRPTVKQNKQLAREKRLLDKLDRNISPDPREKKEKAILKHTGWKR